MKSKYWHQVLTKHIIDTRKRNEEKVRETKKNIGWVCSFCKKHFDLEKWQMNETCIHCSKFLDNPPNIQKMIKREQK